MTGEPAGSKLISRDAAGRPDNRMAAPLGITPDGTQVLFFSPASNLVPRDAYSPDYDPHHDLFVGRP